jgi:hypothetical protein
MRERNLRLSEGGQTGKIDFSSFLEQEKRNAIGAIVLIVAKDSVPEDPVIWLLRENETRISTGKKVNDISVVFETKKIDELLEDNIRGGMAEVLNDADLAAYTDSLFLINGLSHRVLPRFKNGLSADLLVLGFSGNTEDTRFTPVNGEVSPYGWKPVSALSTLGESIRPELTKLLEHEEYGVKTLIADFIRESNFGSSNVFYLSQTTMFPNGFSMLEFHDNREREPNVIPSVLPTETIIFTSR